MTCIKFANGMNSTTIISTFNSDNSNIAKIKTQIMTTITKGILEFKPMTETPIQTNYTFFTVFAFVKINSFS